MLALFDTNIYIDLLLGKINREVFLELFQKYIIRLCPIVYHELIRGAKNSEKVTEIKRKTVMLTSPTSFMWEKAGTIIRKMKPHDFPLEKIQNDILIALTAIHHGATLITQDQHFQRIGTLLPLKLEFLKV